MTKLPDTVTDVVECAADVNNELGPKQTEHAYHQAFIVCLSDRGIQLSTEGTITIDYRGNPVARMHPDLIIGGDEKLIVELKHEYDGSEQLRRYLNWSDGSIEGVVGGVMCSFGSELAVRRFDQHGNEVEEDE